MNTYIIFSCKKEGKGETGFSYFRALFSGNYRRNNEKWLYLLPSKGQFPDEKILKKTKCIIIPGSDISAYDDLPFLRETEKFLKKLVQEIIFENKYPQLKIYGTCFGMQIFFSSLGVKVEKSNYPQHTPVDIDLNEKFWEAKFVKNSKVEKKNLKIYEWHNDIVTNKCDEKYGINLVGSSEKCEHEIYIDNQEKIFMIEGHPEYDKKLMVATCPGYFLKSQKLEKNEENIKKVIEQCESTYESDSDDWKKICFNFIKN